MFASHRKLSNLTVIIDRNGLQQGAATEATVGLDPLEGKLQAFGCNVITIDGHDPIAILDALGATSNSGRPTCVIAETTKGAGVSFMEDNSAWHHKIPNVEERSCALSELAS